MSTIGPKYSTPRRATLDGYDLDLDKLFDAASTAIFQIEEHLTLHYGIEAREGWRQAIYAARYKLGVDQYELRRYTRDCLDARDEQAGNSDTPSTCSQEVVTASQETEANSK